MQEKLENVAQPIWSSGCPTLALKQAKNTKNAFLAYVGQSDNHIGIMPFASIYPTNPRINP